MSTTTLSRKGLILIAEDVKVIAFKMTNCLEQARYRVELAEDGLQCLEKARTLRPDLILLDIMMPQMHGIEVMKRLRRSPETRNIGVIVCSAKGFDTEQVEMAELGAHAFLIKPVSPPLLLEKVEEYFVKGRRAATTPLPAQTAPPAGEAFMPRLQTRRGCLTLWGTRGSTPTPGAAFLRHGGQTSCMGVPLGDKICIFDAGSGIRDLGAELMKTSIRTVHLFITHTHWDHIQGFPFFAPAYDPEFKITIYGARGFGKDLKSLFSGQLDRDYFPVQMEDMKAALNFVQLAPEPVEVNGARVTWDFTNHPGATVAYKLELDGWKLAWVPDNEFLEGYIGAPDGIGLDHEKVSPHLKLIEFLSGVDLLIHEAQFTNEEYPGKIGWGHTGLSNACLLARLAEARRWIITHHDPSHDDQFLEVKLNLTRQLLDRIGHPIPVAHGHDGMMEYF